MIFSISNTLDSAEKISPGTFIDLNIWERQHIEQWVRVNPEILGEDLLVLTTEFDRFINSSDRLDLLALDSEGNLVVVELKRDSVAGHADLQAIRYAAMVSSMTIEKLLPYYVAYRKKHYAEELSNSDARNQLANFVGPEPLTEFPSKPRIILCSEDFAPEITTTVLWLNKFDVDISCVKITPYKVGDKIIIVPRVVIPLEEAKQYLIDIKVKEDELEQSAVGKTRRTMRVLVENGLVKTGDMIYLKNALPSYVHYLDNDPTFEASITGKLGRSNAVQWKKDGSEHSISELAWSIFKNFHPEHRDPGGINGNWHWVNSAGTPLWTLAEEFLAKPSD
jgi:hypothetical protein